MPQKKKAAPEASIGQRVFVARITGKDNRGSFLSAEDAERIISDYVHKKNVSAIMRGQVVKSTFHAQAKRLYDWAASDKHAPEVIVRKVGKAWVFTPATASKAGGFPV